LNIPTPNPHEISKKTYALNFQQFFSPSQKLDFSSADTDGGLGGFAPHTENTAVVITVPTPAGMA
jgi:hypothetical protein